jgi:hypothetical protein
MRKYLSLLSKMAAALLGLFAVGVGTGSVQAKPAVVVLDCRQDEPTMSMREKVQCACEAALNKNTIEALENFLLEYGDEDAKCSALASTALADFGGRANERDGGDTLGEDDDPGGYGG